MVFVDGDEETTQDPIDSTLPTDEPTEGGPTDDEGTDDETEDPEDPEDPLFDVGTSNEESMGQPAIPETCEESHHFPSNFGCEFFSLDLDQKGLLEYGNYGVAVANPHADQPAWVEVTRFANGGWTAVVGPVEIMPGEHIAFELLDIQKLGTGIFDSAAYRVASDVPIAAIQFSPIDGSDTESTSATLLHPTSSWTSSHTVLGWRTHPNVGERAFISALALVDATSISVTPNAPIIGAGEIPGIPEGVEVVHAVGEGQLLQLAAMSTFEEVEEGIAASTLVSGGEHPTTVFSAHTCAAVPQYFGHCGHIQEQLSSQLAGNHFVAARLPIRDVEAPETTQWQILATEADTLVSIVSIDPIPGLPPEQVLQPGEPFVPEVGGPIGAGDFEIFSDKPIVIAAYMTNPTAGGWGSPAMVQLAPAERFIQEHFLFFPPNFAHQNAVITRAPGTDVWINDQVVGDDLFTIVDEFEVARVELDPGAHHIVGEEPLSVVATGWKLGDGYAYLGGWGIPVPPYPAPE